MELLRSQDNCLFKVCPNRDKEDDADDAAQLKSPQNWSKTSRTWSGLLFAGPQTEILVHSFTDSQLFKPWTLTEGSVIQFFNIFDWVQGPHGKGDRQLKHVEAVVAELIELCQLCWVRSHIPFHPMSCWMSMERQWETLGFPCQCLCK